MANQDEALLKKILESKLGKYDIVRLALDWISVKKYDEDFRNLTQNQLISKAISDVLSGEVTYELIEELRKKNKAHKNSQSSPTPKEVEGDAGSKQPSK
ncbi:MAG: hypothetical protein LBC07_06100 [Elusimicrobiota bacterium]|jgi:DNA gyrase/topoisomerase IV subunit B|nr:hypothetical protein [Elusimicrobiota bacterium]